MCAVWIGGGAGVCCLDRGWGWCGAVWIGGGAGVFAVYAAI